MLAPFWGIALAAQENLALKAEISSDAASYDDNYLPKFAATGKIPEEGTRDDLKQSWAVRGDNHREGAMLMFRWDAPVDVREILVFARTAWGMECWSSCDVYCGDEAAPIVSVPLEARHGPQRITLPETKSTALLRLAFKKGGGNPGASEIMVFAAPVSEEELAKLSSAYTSAAAESEASKQVQARVKAGDLGFTKMVLVHRRQVDPSHVYTYHVEGLSNGGGLYLLTLADSSLQQLVDTAEGIILDCQVSYDGTQILFSWKRTMNDPFEIWRINADGTGLTKILADAANNLNACWLPDGGIAFMSDRKPAFAYCWTSTSPVLYRADGDGKNVVKLSANYLTDFTPAVMTDGRIMFSRWEYVDRPAIPIQSLWAINPDGTSLAGVFGNRVLSPATFMEARDVPGKPGHILCVMTSHNGPCRGAIGLLDLTKGGNAQEAIRNLTPDVRVRPVNDGDGNDVRGPYESPLPLDGTYFLVSRKGTVLLRDYEGTVDVPLCPPQGGCGYYSPQPLRARALPQTPRPHRVDPNAAPWADIVMHDVRIGLGDAVKPGEVKRLAVVQEMEKDIRSDVSQRQFGFQFPVVSCGATYAPKRVLGFATVEPDGSAHFRVPAGIPVYFLPLDAEGRAVQRMRTFTHFMPGEKQSCIGCHADRNYVSPTQVTQQGRSIAAARAAEELTPPEWGSKDGFSFARVVQPVLNQHCVKCHSGNNPKTTLELSGDRTDYFNVAYEHLARQGTQAEHGNDAHGGMAHFGTNPYTSWIPSFNGCESNILEIEPKRWGSPASKLADTVISGHPDAEGKNRVALTPGERLKILMWIDLDVPFYGTSQSLQPELRGCRKIMPPRLAETLTEVSERRGFELPQTFFVRLDNPAKNPFLAVPLAKGQFTSTDDPDYKRILACFDGVQDMLEKRIDVDYRKVMMVSNDTK